jgi:hypothetical protein
MQTFRRWNVNTPLWSKIAFSGRHAPSETITTGTVEQYIGVTKHSHHPKLNEPEDKFILVHTPYVSVKARIRKKANETALQEAKVCAELLLLHSWFQTSISGTVKIPSFSIFRRRMASCPLV